MQMRIYLAAFLALFLVATSVHAHESRPLYVEIVEQSPNVFSATWKIPPSAASVTAPRLVFPKNCKASGPSGGTGLVRRQLFSCASGLSGSKVQVAFPGYNPSISTLFRLQRLSGEKHTTIASPKEPSWIIPDREATAPVARQYFVLGVEHILKGFDHLLFVACLIFIAGSLRRVLITITGFTIAHSITLALSALGFVRIPTPPVEAAIALSIVFLATEIARERRNTLTWRYPVLVSASFGLLHGFGFATVLREIGLPQTEIITALLFFNIGVEAGQVLFVAALVGLLAAVRTFGRYRLQQQVSWEAVSMPRMFVVPVAYAIGGLASWWTFARLASFVS